MSGPKEEARAWLSEHWRGVDDREWRDALFAAGYAMPSWPRDAGGRACEEADSRAIASEFKALGAPGACRELNAFDDDVWLFLAGEPIVAFGTVEQQGRLLRGLAAGDLGKGCLLYSEPGAGSDLAAVQTRADLDGDHYLVRGQKVWTSGAEEADFGLLLARTDWDVPKHAGLSFFIFPMRQTGVEVRPIHQITGASDFSEVFLDARVPAADLIGGPGNGWKVIQVALAAERRGMGELRLEARGDERSADPGKPVPLFARSNDLIELARSAGRLDDPLVREEIMKIHTWRLVNDWTAARSASDPSVGGAAAAASLGKLANSRILHRAAALRYELLGQRVLQYDEAADPEAYRVDYDLMMSFINSIGGGSDQIQRNIIGERVLGLPKGPEPDRGVPFRDVLKAAPTRSFGEGKER